MAESEAEPVAHSKSAPARISLSVRPTLSLGNRESTAVTNFQPVEQSTQPLRSVDNLRTYIVWSIFNLLLIPFGILCCYFTYKVRQFKRQNRYEAAKKWSKRTFVVNIMSTLIMFGVIITAVMLHYDYIQRHSDTDNTRTPAPYIPWQPGR